MRTDEFKARLQAWYDDELRHARGVSGEAAAAVANRIKRDGHLEDFWEAYGERAVRLLCRDLFERVEDRVPMPSEPARPGEIARLRDARGAAARPGRPLVNPEHINSPEAMFYMPIVVNGRHKLLGECTASDLRGVAERHEKQAVTARRATAVTRRRAADVLRASAAIVEQSGHRTVQATYRDNPAGFAKLMRSVAERRGVGGPDPQ